MSARVGFLGLGVMGKPMALRMLEKGASVAVWNRTASKCDDLIKAGAIALPTPAAVVESCTVTHAMLSDPAASESVVFGEDGTLAAMRQGRAYIDHSTVDEACGERIGSAIATAGGRFLAAPVSGGWRDAAKGELLMICGGEKALFDEVKASSMGLVGHKQWYVGATPTSAARAKLMLQVMMGSYIGALAEMLALTERAGLDPSQVLEVFNNSAMANPISAAKGAMMTRRAFRPDPPNFQVYLQQKDLRLALGLADQLGMPAPISAAVNAQYIAARQRGFADADFAAVREAYDEPVTKG